MLHWNKKTLSQKNKRERAVVCLCCGILLLTIRKNGQPALQNLSKYCQMDRNCFWNRGIIFLNKEDRFIAQGFILFPQGDIIFWNESSEYFWMCLMIDKIGELENLIFTFCWSFDLIRNYLVNPRRSGIWINHNLFSHACNCPYSFYSHVFNCVFGQNGKAILEKLVIITLKIG